MTPTPPLTYQFNATEVITDFVKKHRLAVEALTETQLAEAIRQAIACGDFGATSSSMVVECSLTNTQ